MTKQESFKKRVRARMTKTGERYNAARRALLAEAKNRPAHWVSEPEMSDDAVRSATGHGWDDWVKILDAWGGRTAGHPAIAAHVHEELGVDAWWSQGVTVGYERITGLRLPHQMSDGTFTANVTRTIHGSATTLRTMLDDDASRSDLFGDTHSEARSRPGVKAPRFAIGPGVATISVTAKKPSKGSTDERMVVSVQHQLLPTFDDVEEWKFFWAEWISALDESGSA